METSVQIQNFKSYREYIEEKLKNEPFGRGGKALLAKHLSCQPSFISQILKERAVLSLEQAHDINAFFEHNKLEKDYFMNLVEHNNSGTIRLKEYFNTKLNELNKKFKLIENRFDFEELPDQEIISYYNNKINVLTHHLINIPKYGSREALSNKLGVSMNEVCSSVEFLIKNKLIEEYDEGKLRVLRKNIHIKKDSPLSQYANINIRLQNIKDIKTSKPGSISYAAHFTCSGELYEQLKSKLIETISDFSNELPKDTPEQLNSIVLDLKEI